MSSFQAPGKGALRRRGFLAASGALGVSGLLGRGAQAITRTRKIALEEHFSTADLEKRGYVARPTSSDTVFADIEKRLQDFDQLRLETMDEAGIDMSVLSVTTPGIQGVADPKTAVELARQVNDFLAGQIQKRPKRYAGFAAVAMQDPAAAAVEVERAIRQLGFKGALINGQTGGHYLDDQRFLPFWERVHDLDVPVYLHPGELPDHPMLFAGRPELDGPVWAWTSDSGGHALRLVFSGLFKRFPRLKVILGHMGETLPYLLWRLDSRFDLQVGHALPPEEQPSAIIKRHFVITTSGVFDPGPLSYAIGAMGEDSVLFSVDYPYENSKVAADFIDSAPVGDAVRAKVCRGNASRILRL
jgi:2,3-dihydroxybenzoate decarboxylase